MRWRGDRATRGARHPLWLGVVAALVIAATPQVALAHARLVRSAPAAGAHLSAAPVQIRLWFSEAAEATMTSVTLTGPNGVPVRIGRISVDAGNPLELVATLASPLQSPLTAGRYTLRWRTVAADDGHPSQGAFFFTIDSVASPQPAPPLTTGSAAPKQDASRTTATTAHPLDLQAPSVILVRWLTYAALVLLIGVVAFRMLLISRLNTAHAPDHTAQFREQASLRAAGLGLIAAVAAIAASISRVYAEQAIIGHGVRMSTILESFWGQVWLFQLAITIIACAAFAMAWRMKRSEYRRIGWIVAALAAVLLGASPALSGHAVAAPEHRAISVALDVIHVIAAGAWMGGLLSITIAGIPAAVSVAGSGEGSESTALIAALVNAFSPVALVFATTVVASGAVAAWLRLGSLGALLHSGYGRVLLIKLGFVALVLAGGAFNWLRMRGVLSQREAAAPAVAAFRRSAWLELSAGILVIVATAVLVATQPPVH